MVITSATAAYSSARVYTCVTMAGALVCTHRIQLEGGRKDLMDVRLIVILNLNRLL